MSRGTCKEEETKHALSLTIQTMALRNLLQKMASPRSSADHSASASAQEQFCTNGRHNRRNCVSVLVVTAPALHIMQASNSPRHLLRRLRDVNIKMSKS